jgi:hypothetical protein
MPLRNVIREKDSIAIAIYAAMHRYYAIVEDDQVFLLDRQPDYLKIK